MNGAIDIRPHAVKNIRSNLNQRVTGANLKDDSVSTHTPCSHALSRRLELPGFVFREFLGLWRTQNVLPHNRKQFRGCWEEKCKQEIHKTRSKKGKFCKSVVILSVVPNVNTGDVQWHRLLKGFNWGGSATFILPPHT